MILPRRQTPPAPRARLWRLCALLLCALLAPWHSAAQAGADVRIIIDVSGSMKETDPRNLRVSALRLLAGLLPGDGHAGVWTFGRYVNMLVPHGPIDTAWRDRARRAATGIGSLALHTDIEAALRAASWNWQGAPASNEERHLILLTDGLIDIMGGEAASAQARERITHEILPRLQQAGASVHAIALADGTDEALLRQMAAATGGRFERVDDADTLERVFLRLFERALPAVTLPLRDDQRFAIDADIAELTVLAFRVPGSAPTRLHTPDGGVFSTTNLAPNMRWHHEERYDLVTVTRPSTGEWRIDAAFDPDNRALIVSDLALISNPPPAQWLAGAPTALTTHLSAHGRVLDRNDFHHFLRVSAIQQTADGETRRATLLDNGRDGDALAGDGVYTLALPAGMTAGLHELFIEVDGTTFQRARRHTVEVLTLPVTIDLRQDGGIRELFVAPLARLINADSLRLTATITNDGAFAGRHPVTRRAPNEWYLDLSAYHGRGPYGLELEIEAMRSDGQALRLQQTLRFGADGVEIVPIAPAAETLAAPDLAVIAEPARDDGSPDWTRIGLVVMLLNLFTALLALLIYRRRSGAHTAPAEPTPEPAAVTAPAPPVPKPAPKPAPPTAASTAAPAGAATVVSADEKYDDTTTLPEELPEEVLAAYFAPAESAGTAAKELAEDSASETQTTAFIDRIMLSDTEESAKPAGAGADDPLRGIDISDIELDFDERAQGSA